MPAGVDGMIMVAGGAMRGRRSGGQSMKRRSFFGGAFAGLTALSVNGRASRIKPGDVPKRTFGKTGEKLSVIGQAGGRFPLCTFEEAKAVTRRAYELGLNYFDNAHSYWNGRSEVVYGEALADVRKEVFLTTKSVQRTRKGAEEELHTSLKRLKTDYLDLWQIHSVKSTEDLKKIFAPGGAIEAFEAAKKAGKCRFIGFTGHHDPEAHLEMLGLYKEFDTILMPLNPADPAYLSFEQKVLPAAQKQGLGIQGMKSLANAKLLQSMSVKQCLTYVLSLPIHCLAVGCTTLGQIEDDVRITQKFAAYGEKEMAAMRKKGAELSGPDLEDWKRDTRTAMEGRRTREYRGA
jgi:predicted aldo/keto reductase-like oxidoreductase